MLSTNSLLVGLYFNFYLTERAEDGVGEPIPDRQLPLRGDNQTKCSDKEEICNKSILCGNASPLHQAQ